MKPDSRMTKDQLREALDEVGVKVSTKLKKAELVKLYREKVLNQNVSTVSPNDSLIGGFSSDEEDLALPLDTSHITADTDVLSLTNDEIFYKLKELGQNVGPILDSTRSIYAKKLAKILGAPEVDTGYHFGDGEDDKVHDISAFSADEEEEAEEDQVDDIEKDSSEEVDLETLQEKAFKRLDDMVAVDKKFEDLLDKEAANLKSTRSYHEKVQEDNGTTTRSRRLETTRSYTSQTNKPETNGKVFVPPPPKKANKVLYIVIAVLALLAIGALVWFNLEDSAGLFSKVPMSEVPVRSEIPAQQQQAPPVAEANS